MVARARGVLLLIGVAALAAVMMMPTSVGTAAAGPVRLADDPSSFPAANYSNLDVAPLPEVPHTTPIVVNVTAYGTVAIPTGTWETVLMNYTGYTAGTAYDYFQTVTIDGAMVYVGVNPEAGHWTQFVNLSEYLAFFDGQSSITISGPSLGSGTNFEGIQDNYISLVFYPVPARHAGPSYPTEVIPLFQFSGTPSSTSVTIPTDASAVVLQMMAIGSEFWYSLNPDFTAVTVSVGGTNVSNYLQYPWINSGGIDLFSWRPIFPVNMLNHQWEDFNLTGALGLIEGTHDLNATPAAGSLGADVIANLLVYTSPTVLGAHSVSYSYRQAPVRTTYAENASLVNLNGNNYTFYDQADRISYDYSSRITTTTGQYTASLSTQEEYVNDQTLTALWQNITESEVTTTQTTTTYNERNLHGEATSSQTLSYPLAMDLGEVLTYLYSEDGGSLQFYNYTSDFLNVEQGYFETDASAAVLNGVASSSSTSIENAIVHTNGVFVSLLEIGPGYAIILNITSSQHTTNKVYAALTTQRTGDRTSVGYYYHALSGVEDNSTSYYVEENVTQNVVVAYELSFGGGRSAPSLGARLR